MNRATWIKTVCAPLLDIADQYLSFPSKMEKMGWHQLKVIRENLEELDFDKALEEFDKVQLEKAKENFGRSAYTSLLLKQLQAQADERYRFSKNPVDQAISQWERTVRRYRTEHRESFNKLINELRHRQELALEEELATKLLGLHSELSDSKRTDRLKLIHLAIAHKLGNTGFKWDSTIASGYGPVYCMDLVDGWKLILSYDRDSLFADPVFDPRAAGSFFFLIVVQDGVTIKNWTQSEHTLFFDFITLFPLASGNIFAAYRNFANLKELEINLLANFDLLLMILDDMVKGLNQGLSNLHK